MEDPRPNQMLEGAGQLLKQCPLCNALNSVEMDECFICSWHGEFSYDEDEIRASLDELMGRLPNFEPNEGAFSLPAFPRVGISDRLKLFVRRVRGIRPLDFNA